MRRISGYFRRLLVRLGFLRPEEENEFGKLVRSYLFEAVLSTYGLKAEDRLAVLRAARSVGEDTLDRILSAPVREIAVAEEASKLCELANAGHRRGSFHALFSDALTEAALDIAVATDS